MPDLPAELWINILARLSTKELVRLTCVSKEWNDTIQDPQLAITQFQRSIKTKSHPTIFIIPYSPIMSCYFSLNFFDDTRSGKLLRIKLPWQHPPLVRDIIFGNCNGLVCMRDGACFLLWNPSIRKFKRIPSSPFSILWYQNSYGGFGYDSVNDDYKLVSFMDCGTYCLVHMYSLKSRTWKRIQDLPLKKFVVHSMGVFLKGTLHWLMRHETDDETMIIGTLDLVSEEFCQFTLPIHMFHGDISDKNSIRFNLVVVEGYLCIYRKECGSRAWIMREYGVAESWTMLYSLDNNWIDGCKPLMLSSCGKMVLLQDSHYLVWYDLRNGKRKTVRIDGMILFGFHDDMPKCFDAIISVGSIHHLQS
ncbi:PREDICTED: F-box [Prunus dulcis]|uniref:PREDICTED: F-box n=1 Tax=Prunus dulcis TaxID=3755 RepID=A0A5E4F260_PRUDU|nr:PREDICTED: F-box [Prunus dulcis]